jgi:hypothetical protein
VGFVDVTYKLLYPINEKDWELLYESEYNENEGGSAILGAFDGQIFPNVVARRVRRLAQKFLAEWMQRSSSLPDCSADKRSPIHGLLRQRPL